MTKEHLFEKHLAAEAEYRRGIFPSSINSDSGGRVLKHLIGSRGCILSAGVIISMLHI